MNNHRLAGKHRPVGNLKLARRTLRVLMALALVVPLFAYLAPSGASAAPPAAGYSVDFAAARPDTYDHSTGGGVFDDGGNSYVVESLEGGDFSCGDLVSYLTEVTRTGGSGADTIQLNYEFGVRATNGANAGHILAVSALVNYGAGDTGIVDDGGSVATLGAQVYDDGTTPSATYPPSADDLLVPVTVTDVEPGEAIVVRVDVLLGCGTVTKNGNIQASLDSAEVVGGSTINVGNQTIPFKNVQLLLPGLTSLTVEKVVDTQGAPSGVLFPFTMTDEDPFSLSDGQSQSHIYSIPVGEETLDVSAAEGVVPSDWSFVSASCVDATGAPVGTVTGQSAAVTLSDGDDITCTFHNEYTPPATTTTTTEATTTTTTEATTTTTTEGTTTTTEGTTTTTQGERIRGTTTSVTVEATVVTRETSTTAAVQGTTETLPFTGSSSTALGGAGIALVLLGGLVLLAFRKQEDPIIETDVARRIDSHRV
jgi:LPXTG-motif cell wall-anchored protein